MKNINGHNFIENIKSIPGYECYICTNCNLPIFKVASGKHIAEYNFVGFTRGFIEDELKSCDEYIIQQIIE